MNDARHVTVARCARCGTTDGSAVTRCRKCGSDVVVFVAMPGRGTLVSWTVVRRPSGPFAHRDAFAVALVDLDGGPLVTGNLDGWEDEPPLGAVVHVVDAIDGVPVFASDPPPGIDGTVQ